MEARAIEPNDTTKEDKPFSERTQAIITRLESTHQELLDVTEEVKKIREMMLRNESWRQALWRAVKQFIGDITNGK